MKIERRAKRTAIKLLQLAATKLPEDVTTAIRRAREEEDSEVAQVQLDNILRNIRMADQMELPMCQDTGLIVFFNELGRMFPKEPDISSALLEATREATESIPLRPNAVHPITRVNTGNNVGVGIPIIKWEITDTDYLDLTVMLKGAGSENMSRLLMLNPSAGTNAIVESVTETVIASKGKPCPPTILGVGIGGTTDETMNLAKKATIRPLDKRNPDPILADLEKRLLETVNGTGIGPMGLGGRTTALGVQVEYAYCHTASLPVGINVQCWAARKARARIFADGSVEILSHGGETPD